jgi:hypothetical protein
MAKISPEPISTAFPEAVKLHHSLINSHRIPKPPIYREYLEESMNHFLTLSLETVVTQYLSETSRLKPAT